MQKHKKTNKTDQPEPRNGIDRRKFLAGAVATTAAFTILKPSQVRGTQANSRIKAGCIGLGGRGKMIAKMIQEHGGYQITAAADYFPEVVNKAGETFGVSKDKRYSGLSGYKKLIASDVDAVFCETPPYCFPDHITEAVKNKRHVYLAKPVACDVPGCLQVAKMGKKATQNKTVFLVDFQMRTDPFVIGSVKCCHEGKIGKSGLMSSFYGDNGFRDPPLTKTIESRLQRLTWVNDIAIGGGLIVNCDIHAIDVALWIARAHPISAMGSARKMQANKNGDTHDIYSITYNFEDGSILSHRGDHLRNTNGGIRCEAYGQFGFCKTNYGGKSWANGNKGGFRGGEVKNLYRQGAIRNIAAFHKSITSGQYDNSTVAPSVDSTLATILGRQAANKGRPVTWDEMIKENKRIELDLSALKA